LAPTPTLFAGLRLLIPEEVRAVTETPFLSAKRHIFDSDRSFV
jgi:hypothetical protein